MREVLTLTLHRRNWERKDFEVGRSDDSELSRDREMTKNWSTEKWNQSQIGWGENKFSLSSPLNSFIGTWQLNSPFSVRFVIANSMSYVFHYRERKERSNAALTPWRLELDHPFSSPLLEAFPPLIHTGFLTSECSSCMSFEEFHIVFQLFFKLPTCKFYI